MLASTAAGAHSWNCRLGPSRPSSRCVRACVCVREGVWVCGGVWVRLCTRACLFMCVCVCARARARVCACGCKVYSPLRPTHAAHPHTHTHTPTHTHTHTHAHTQSPKTDSFVYFEQSGKHRLPELFASGVTVTDIERHYVFLSEFMWEVHKCDRQTGCDNTSSCQISCGKYTSVCVCVCACVCACVCVRARARARALHVLNHPLTRLVR